MLLQEPQRSGLKPSQQDFEFLLQLGCSPGLGRHVTSVHLRGRDGETQDVSERTTALQDLTQQAFPHLTSSFFSKLSILSFFDARFALVYLF